jgi:hypothetical protein
MHMRKIGEAARRAEERMLLEAGWFGDFVMKGIIPGKLDRTKYAKEEEVVAPEAPKLGETSGIEAGRVSQEISPIETVERQRGIIAELQEKNKRLSDRALEIKDTADHFRKLLHQRNHELKRICALLRVALDDLEE